MKKTVFILSFLLLFSVFYAQEAATNEQPKETVKPAPAPAPAPVTETQPEKITEPEQPKEKQPPVTTPVKPPEQVAPVQNVNEEAKLMAQVDANTKTVEVYSRLLKIYGADGRHKERLKVALKAIQNIGGSANLYLIVGDENKFLGDYQKALISYQFALKIMPTDANIYNLIGLVLLKMSNFNQAEAAFRAAIYFGSSGSPYTKGFFYNNLAVCYEAMRDLKTAYRYFQTALKYYPGYKTAQDNVIRVKSNLKASGINVD